MKHRPPRGSPTRPSLPTPRASSCSPLPSPSAVLGGPQSVAGLPLAASPWGCVSSRRRPRPRCRRASSPCRICAPRWLAGFHLPSVFSRRGRRELVCRPARIITLHRGTSYPRFYHARSRTFFSSPRRRTRRGRRSLADIDGTAKEALRVAAGAAVNSTARPPPPEELRVEGAPDGHAQARLTFASARARLCTSPCIIFQSIVMARFVASVLQTGTWMLIPVNIISAADL